MFTLIISIVVLIIGYIIYGKVAEKVFVVDKEAKTPAIVQADGVDYIPMKPWRIFLIQFLNIAGLGPIFGAIMGIFFGPSAFLWIVFGTIFAGGVHDYLSGMMSTRIKGLSLPEVVGGQLGIGVKMFMRILSVVLLVLLTASFLFGVCTLLQELLPLRTAQMGEFTRPIVWIAIIFGYFLLATVCPIDKIIGKFYPIFGGILLFMGIGICIVMFSSHSSEIPSILDGLQNRRTDNLPLFPMMFVSIACGAISGFHGTQSPLMARCITSEKQGRPIFYGAMVCEGILALIWAAAAGTFFADPAQGLYGIDGLQAFAAQHPGENIAALVVDRICRSWLGTIGGILAIIGVIIAPITSGDTAMRSARLIVADAFNIEQKSIKRRLELAIPLFMFVFVLAFVDFDAVWRYFSWVNQTLAAFTLWAGAVLLYYQEHKRVNPAPYKYGYLIAFIPAAFMTMVSTSYIFIAPEGFKLAAKGLSLYGYIIGAAVTFVCELIFQENLRLKLRNQ